MKVHIFDIDHTLIKGSTAFYFLIEALRKKQLSLKSLLGLPFQWFLYKLAIIDPEFIENQIHFLKGIKEETIRKLNEEAFKLYTKKNIFKEACELIEGLKKKGNRIIFATSSFNVIIDPLMDFFKINEALSSNLEVVDGKCTGKITGEALFANKKLTAVASWLVREGIDFKDVYFYSDSYNDLPTLEAAGNPIAVNPDRRLLKKASKQGWPILKFKETLK